ncbi:MAG: aminotransferase class I/II-fold pyridoxal phosphate-dependent enzyme [Pararobbsia sp.]
MLRAGQSLPEHWRHLIIVNPNNPTAEVFDPATLLAWHTQLVERGGYLIVDEAFADATPEHSIAFASGRPGLVVLRSVGKFFGLAGARAGFMLAEPGLLEAARCLRGPWTIAGPARAVVRAALLDTAWQRATRAHLPLASERLSSLLAARGLRVFRTSLFAWTPDPRAAALHEALAKTGIWVRYFDQVPSLRFGLPRDEAAWQTLSDGLRHAIR